VELRIEFSPSAGADFATQDQIDPQLGYQSIVTMTVKKYINGTEDTSFNPSGVTWEVNSSIDGLSVTDPSSGYGPGIWKRAASAKNGLAWVASDSESIDGATDWESDTIKGTTPDGKTAYLADIVGSRTVTVKATAGGKDSSAATFTFGKGPLSVFSKSNVGTGGYQLQWQNGSSYPAAESCGGTIVGDVVITGTVSSTSAGFGPSASGGWSNAYDPGPGFGRLVRYAENSKLAKLGQMLAVGKYDASRFPTILRKGAFEAAGWDDVSYGTGELFFSDGSGSGSILMGAGFGTLSVSLGGFMSGVAFVSNLTDTHWFVCVN
jgi:hypothetical protein